MLTKFSLETQILLSLAIILAVSFLITRITKLLKLPNVTAYIIAGVLIGPAVLKIVPSNIVDNIPIISKEAVLQTLADNQTGTGYFSYKNVSKIFSFVKDRINIPK